MTPQTLTRPAPPAQPATAPNTLARRGAQVEERLLRWLAAHSIDVLRISLGLVFLGFGALKFVPGASPAEALAVRTVETLSLGLAPGGLALLVTALAECFIGLTLLSGKLLRVGLAVLAASMVGIMSPLVLFFGELFPGTPTLEGQYVLKDIVLVAAGLVVTARAMGARLVADPLALRVAPSSALRPRQRRGRRCRRCDRLRGPSSVDGRQRWLGRV